MFSKIWCVFVFMLVCVRVYACPMKLAPYADSTKIKTRFMVCNRTNHKETETDDHLSLVMRKPVFCICENKDADQLRGNREADQRLCFRYIDSTIPLLSKSEVSSL